MSEFIHGIVILALYRVCTISCSVAIIFWGYGLLRSKTSAAPAADVSPASRLMRSATGAMLALLGAVTLVVSLLRGIDVDALATGVAKSAASNSADSAVSNAAVPRPPDDLEACTRGGLPDGIRQILNKATDGQVLLEPDKKILRDWISNHQSIGSGPDQPKTEARKRNPRRVPVPAPGEV
jgi:hypothetical protein